MEYAKDVTVSLVDVQSATAAPGVTGELGSTAAGVMLSYADNAVVAGCQFSDLSGGKGTRTQWYCGDSTQCGTILSGGLAAAIAANNSLGLNCIGNTATGITGGAGIEGGFGNSKFSPGMGGIGAGIYLSASPLAHVAGNTFADIHGGETAESEGSHPEQVGFGLYLEDDSLQTSVPLTNTIDGDTIVFLNGVDGAIISGLSLDSETQPTNLGKIVVLNSQNVVC